MKKPSLRDIARESGVSLKTVSRILRGEVENHKKETCDNVWAVARRLQYRPNLAAGAVFGRKTKTVGIMIPFGYEGDFYGRIVKGAHDELTKNKYAPILVFATPELDLREQIHRLIDRRVDGILLRPMYEKVDDILLEEVINRDLPLVIVMRPTDMRGRVDFVGSDDYEVGRMAARHLLGLGHRSIAFLGIDNTDTINPENIVGRRWTGFHDTVVSAGGKAYLSYRNRTNAEPAEMACEILGQQPRPTGIFAPMDRMCLGIYAAALKKNLRIPEDLSVVGCANMDYTPFMYPPLTSIDLHPEAMGATAVTRLIRRIGGTLEPAMEIMIASTLIKRESTAALK